MLLKKSKSNNDDTLEIDNSISNFKLLVLILTGVLGLIIFSLIGESIAKAIPRLDANQISGITNFITYALLFASLLGILNKDIIKLKNSFTNWKSYVYGIIIGFIIIAIQLGYSNIVNLFYNTNVSDNEASLRSFISIYPSLSIIVLCFVGPFCEEIIYRLGLFSFFKFNKIVAYIISILIFSLMHFNPMSPDIVNELINLPMYILSAIGLTVAFDKLGFAGSLTAHTLNNLWSVIGILIVTNLR